VPIPETEAHKTAHNVLMNLSTSIAESDYYAFCKALNNITYHTFFKKKQIANQTPSIQALIDEVRYRSDVDGFGMSSMGPMCYAFTKNQASLIKWIEEKVSSGIIKCYWITEGFNSPAIVEVIS
jgi:beta-ribofuranosylaminobenzene 5'-phosphate synthase